MDTDAADLQMALERTDQMRREVRASLCESDHSGLAARTGGYVDCVLSSTFRDRTARPLHSNGVIAIADSGSARLAERGFRRNSDTPSEGR